MSAHLVVQKYGGSSLATADRIRHVARRIVRDRATGSGLVVVVSAMGDTTDELMALAAAITDEPDAREMDMLLATGEHQSATLLSMALHGLGVPAISLTGPQAGITTDGRYGRARIAGIEPRRVHAELAAGKVVIVAGFQGQSAHAADDDEITTLGRGGSDTTAVALAAGWGRSLRDHTVVAVSTRPIPGSCRLRASCRSSATRRCSSSPTRVPRSCRSAPSSSAGSTASPSRS
jgi:aspartate kinase